VGAGEDVLVGQALAELLGVDVHADFEEGVRGLEEHQVVQVQAGLKLELPGYFDGDQSTCF